MESASRDADRRYRHALERLHALARFGMRPGLDAIARVLAHLGHPERRFPALHIAGTNGKGSTAAFAEAMLRGAGARTGLYTSPHLVRYTERVRLDGLELDRARTASTLERAMDAADEAGVELSFFEAATAAAFLAFAEAEVDVAVLECGLGGRLDATNVCMPFATVVTRIELEHTEVLGDTVEKIAFEKAGIAKQGIPLVCGALDEGPRRVMEARAREVGAPLWLLGRDFSSRWTGSQRLDYAGPGGALHGAELGLAGAHQAENAALALAATSLALERFRPDERARRAGLRETSWPGRLERLTPELRVDGAHNPDAARALARTLEGEPPLVLVLGILDDKDTGGVLAALLPHAAHLICTAPPSPRALSASRLAEHARRLLPSLAVEAIPQPEQAVERALRRARADGFQVLVCGSLYLVGAVRALFAAEERDPLVVADPVTRPYS